jgi:RNA polymerase-binding transcription factor DksA
MVKTFERNADLRQLSHMDEALGRMDAGHYGFCFACSNKIAEGRLRAQPFAVRCRTCEERREKEQGRTRESAQRGLAPFSHMVSS